MLETIAIILAVLVVAIVAVLGYAATKPNTISYARSASINAPPEKITPLINDFRTWPRLVTVGEKGSEPEAHLQRQFQRSRLRLCVGRQQERRLRSHGDPRVHAEKHPYQARFHYPLQGEQHGGLHIHSAREVPRNVDWVMTGENRFIGKVMSVFMDFDKMIGKDFEAGLAAMKTAAESK